MDSKNGSLFLVLLSLSNWIISSNYKLADRYDVFAGLLLCVPLCLCARFQWGRSHKCPQNITATTTTEATTIQPTAATVTRTEATFSETNRKLVFWHSF